MLLSQTQMKYAMRFFKKTKVLCVLWCPIFYDTCIGSNMRVNLLNLIVSDKIKNPSKVGKSSPCTVVKQNSGNRVGDKIPACVGLSATCIFERRK